MNNTALPIVSLFSGALGLDLGIERADFCIRVAVECNKFAAGTIRKNRPDITVIERKIETVPTAELLDIAGLDVGGDFIVTGGPSCQPFSTAGRRGSVEDPRGTLFREFLRVVREARPRFFVMENVRGVLSAAIRHRPLCDRGPGCPPLAYDEELGSAFGLILDELRSTGYYVVFDLLNAADFGVPQVRERLLFIGSRDGERIVMPTPTHARVEAPGRLPWRTLREGLAGLHETSQLFRELVPSKREYLNLIPAGGNWRDLPSSIQAAALGSAYLSWGGRSGFLRRLSWDKPAPALTTRPDSKATMLCHPEALRTLSVREYARIQQYDDSWQFDGGIPQQYLQIGNAVPLGLGTAIGAALYDTMCGISDPADRSARLGKVISPNEALIKRICR